MRRVFNILISAGALLLAGCGGIRFSPVAAVPKNKALIYVYREAAFSGMAGHHHIFVNDKAVADLRNGSYYPYIAEQGTNYFSSQLLSADWFVNMAANAQFKNRVCRVDAEAGHTYYVQFEIATTWGPRMTQVEADKGAKDIQDCKLAKSLE